MRFSWVLMLFFLTVLFVRAEDEKLLKKEQVSQANNYEIPFNKEVFDKAYAAFEMLNDSNLHVFAVIDYTKPSTDERFFIYDADQKILLKKLLVAHGKNSGGNLATNFSNQNGSLKSSPGFYRTGATYHGKHGYSLRLYGLESGFNDHAYERAIVIHGADYVNQKFIKQHKRLGRSWGCPAISNDCSKSVIDLIKNGAVIYIHTNDQDYLNNSNLFNLRL